MEFDTETEEERVLVDGNNLKKVDCFKFLDLEISWMVETLQDAHGCGNAIWACHKNMQSDSSSRSIG